MVTTVTENVKLIVDNYSLTNTQSQTSAFNHLISFSSGTPIKNGIKLTPSLTYTGASILENNNSIDFCGGSSYSPETNYETIEIISTPIGISSASSLQAIYTINNIDPVGDKNSVSYDLFEDINPAYKQQSIDFGILVDSYEICVSFLRGPSNQKITNPQSFIESITDSNSFWKVSTPDVNDVCPENIISNDMIATIRVKNNGKYVDMNGKQIVDYSLINGLYQFRSISSGTFKSLNLNSLGTDGRNIPTSLLSTIPINNNINMNLNSNTLYNVVYYPLKTNNTTFNANEITISNQLKIVMNIRYSSTNTTFEIMFSVLLGTKIIAVSDWIKLQTTNLNTLKFFQRNTSKNQNSDYELNGISYVYATDQSSDALLQSLTGEYIPPSIIFSSTYTDIQSEVNDPNFTTIYASNGETMTIHFNVFGSDAVVHYSINGSSFTTGTSTLLTLNEGTYTIKAYTTGINYTQSSYVVKTFNVYRLIAAPVITGAVSGSNYAITITDTDSLDIFYTIGGDDPDTIGFTNCYRYVAPFNIRDYTVIKAVSISSKNSKSLITTSFITPSFSSSASIPSITASPGPNSLGVYQGNTTVTITGDSGTEIRYTLDGSDPSDYNNRYARKYITPFEVRAFNGDFVEIIAVSLSYTKNKSENRKILKFNNSCNSWRLVKKYTNRAPALTSTGSLKLFSGSSITRQNQLINGSYLEFDIIDVNGRPIFDVSYLDVLNDFNFYGNSNGFIGNDIFFPSLSVIDIVGNNAIVGLGARNSSLNGNNYNQYGEFAWKTTQPLGVRIDIIDSLNVPVSSVYLNPILDFKTNHVANRSDFTELIYPDGYLSYKIPNVYIYSNYIVQNVSNNSTNVIEIPNPNVLTNGNTIQISRKGGDPSGQLLIVSTDGDCFYNTVGTAIPTSNVIVKSYQSILFTVSSGKWIYTIVPNYSIYNGYRAIKLTITNGNSIYETPYLPASIESLDLLTLSVNEITGISSTNNSYFIISNITGTGSIAVANTSDTVLGTHVLDFSKINNSMYIPLLFIN